MKEYPLKIVYIGGDDPALISKGFWEPDIFRAVVCEWAQIHGVDIEGPLEVRQMWVRYIPDPEYGCIMWQAKGPGRGNFPITEIDCCWWDRRTAQKQHCASCQEPLPECVWGKEPYPVCPYTRKETHGTAHRV